MVPPSPNSILMNLPNRDELLFLTVWQLRNKIAKRGGGLIVGDGASDETKHHHTTYDSDRRPLYSHNAHKDAHLGVAEGFQHKVCLDNAVLQ